MDCQLPHHRWLFPLLVALLVNSSLLSRLVAQNKQPSILDIPKIMQQQGLDRERAVQMLQQGQFTSARDTLEQAVRRVPHDVLAHYNLACAYAQLLQLDLASKHLRQAISLGYRDRKAIEQDPDLIPLRETAQFKEILDECDRPPRAGQPGWSYGFSVAKVEKNAVTVEPMNCVFNDGSRMLHVLVDTAEAGSGQVVMSPTLPEYRLLNEWTLAGTAAGHIGDLYDNHDRGHSPLTVSNYPQLTAIQFGPALRERQLDNGLQATLLYQDCQLVTTAADVIAETESTPKGRPTISRTIVLGNSSTAVTDRIFWRSQPRLALTSLGGSSALVNHFFNNHLYIYPEHRDHDPGHSEAMGWGDVYFANTPYCVISQGSSGSDQVFLRAFAATLASFQPAVKQKLKTEGLIAPTLQMIMRRCYGSARTQDEYLSGAAHPTVFDGAQLRPELMMRLAHELELNKLPPIVRLQVQDEYLGDPQIDYFDAQPSEEALTTPCAISRVCQSMTYWRHLDVSASGSADLNGLPLKFHWVLLRGDPNRVSIQPIEGSPLSRRLRVAYHERRPISQSSELTSCRVDIGVFADNGHHLSAPAFVSFYFPDNAERTYDDQQRIQSVDYRSAEQNYADPLIAPRRDWRDEYHYSPSGTLSGWTRYRGTAHEDFDASGKLKRDPTSDGAAAALRKVTYQRTTGPDGYPIIRQLNE